MRRGDETPPGAPAAVIARLKERHGFDGWRGRNRLDQHLFIWQMPPTVIELTGWHCRRCERLDDPRGRRLLHTMWAGPGARRALAVEVHECDSRLAAHEWLIRILGEFESPLITRDESVPVGDVLFAAPEQAVLVFARANLVCAIRNAGRDVAPVTEIAREIDGDLVAEPEVVPDGDARPEIRRLEGAPAPGAARRPRLDIPLAVEARDPEGRPLMYKFFSRGGEVLIEDDHLRYRPEAAGPQDIRVYAMSSPRAASRRTLRLARP